MAESQSRYGIIEELNQKKIVTKQGTETLKRDSSVKEIEHNKFIQNLNIEITNKENNFEIDFRNWKANQELDITIKEKEYAQIMENLKNIVIREEKNYEERAQDFIQTKKKNIETENERWNNFKKLRDMEIKAKEEEVEDIDKSIESLKEISKSQDKA